MRVKFDGSSLKKEKITFNHKIIVNIYIVHEINLWSLNIDSIIDNTYTIY